MDMEKRPNDKLEAGEVGLRRGGKIEAGEIREQSKFLKWLDNYWYHYKWPTIFVAIALVAVIIIVAQMTERKEYDFQYVYAGPTKLSVQDTEEMGEVLAGLARGEKFPSPEVAVTAYYLKAQSQVTPDDNDTAQLLQTNREAFRGQVLSGNALIFFMDPLFYAEQGEESIGLLPVREYLPDLPDSALIGEYGLRLDATVLHEHECFQRLPKDTVVCLRTAVSVQSSITGREEALAYHDRYEDVFRRLCGE